MEEMGMIIAYVLAGAAMVIIFMKFLEFLGFLLWMLSPIIVGFFVGWLWVILIWKVRNERYNYSWDVVEKKEDENKEISKRIEEYSERKNQLFQKQHDAFVALKQAEVVDFAREKKGLLEAEYKRMAQRYYHDPVPPNYIDDTFKKHLDGTLPYTFKPNRRFESEYSRMYSSLFGDGR